jgi:hypothetical protein
LILDCLILDGNLHRLRRDDLRLDGLGLGFD